MGVDLYVCSGCAEVMAVECEGWCGACERNYCKECNEEYQPNDFRYWGEIPDLERLESPKQFQLDLPGCRACRKVVHCIDLKNKYFDKDDYAEHHNWKQMVQEWVQRAKGSK
ncbi:hypothetical protein DFS34DRAFT_591013 [Phlyctochytrium arcticum]|nr:hypothetical protein DFS34DRAFT_591013 [Phlyctochytrium arcticum]